MYYSRSFIFSSICKDVNFYKKMVAFVMAYSFTEQDKQEVDEEEEEDSGSCPPVMAPMADILNHVANNNAHLKFEKDEFKMVATKGIKKVIIILFNYQSSSI